MLGYLVHLPEGLRTDLLYEYEYGPIHLQKGDV